MGFTELSHAFIAAKYYVYLKEIFGYADAGFSGGSVRIAAFVDFYVFPADTISYDHFTLYDLSSQLDYYIFRTCGVFSDSQEEVGKKMEQQEVNLCERFEFRDIKPEEAKRAAEIEQICFPPNEACSEQW